METDITKLLREVADHIMDTINPSQTSFGNSRKFDPLKGCENKQAVWTELYMIAKSLGYPDSGDNIELDPILKGAIESPESRVAEMVAKVEALHTISEIMVANDGLDEKRFDFVKKVEVLKILKSNGTGE